VYTPYFGAVITLANQYYQPYLDALHNGPSPVPDITKSQWLLFCHQMYMTQEQPEGLPECE
jgi:hypothetical protein